MGFSDRISGLFLLNPEDAQNRRSLAKNFKKVAITGSEVLSEGDPGRLTTMAWACLEVIQVFLEKCAGFFNHPGLENEKAWISVPVV